MDCQILTKKIHWHYRKILISIFFLYCMRINKKKEIELAHNRVFLFVENVTKNTFLLLY